MIQSGITVGWKWGIFFFSIIRILAQEIKVGTPLDEEEQDC